MSVVLPYDEELASYDLGASHPLKPERFTLAIGLMAEYDEFNDIGSANRNENRWLAYTVDISAEFSTARVWPGR